jgi:hypothetical protein
MTNTAVTTRSFVSAAIGLVLVLWPPVHMTLARNLRFSPWRYGGWGMYATPHPEFLSRVQVVVVPSPDVAVSPVADAVPRADSDSMALREFGLLLDVLREDGIAPLDASLEGDASVMEARSLTRRVRGLRDRDAMRRLAALGCQLASKGEGCPGSLVFVEDPRLDLRARLASAQVDAYCVQRGEVRQVGRFRTDRNTEDQIWTAAAGRCMPAP